MKTPFKSTTTAAALLSALIAATAAAQSPTIATGKLFPIPLTTGQDAQAVCLPTADGRVYLVYVTPTGQIGLWTLTNTNPTPPPKPPPAPPVPPPPTPPVPPLPPTPPPPDRKLTAVITITLSTPAPIDATTQTTLDAAKVSYSAYTVAMVADRNTPPDALTWIGPAANKPLPYTFFATSTGHVLWEGQTPPNATEYAAQLAPYLTACATCTQTTKTYSTPTRTKRK